jgi:hypothetical protein
MTVSSGATSSTTHFVNQDFRNERHIVFPKMLAQNCMDYSSENTMYNKDTDKAGTARRLLSNIIQSENTNVYSLEVSMYGYKPDQKTDKIVPYTEENCKTDKMGRVNSRLFLSRHSTG